MKTEDNGNHPQPANVAQLPGPPDAMPTDEQIRAFALEELGKAPLRWDDLVLAIRRRFGITMESAQSFTELLLDEEHIAFGEDGLVHAAVTTIAEAFAAVAPELIEGAKAPKNGRGAQHSARTVTLASEPLDHDSFGHALLHASAEEVREAMVLIAADEDERERYRRLADRLATLEMEAAAERKARAAASEQEDPEDLRALRKDSKQLVDVMRLLRLRKSVKLVIAELQADLKERKEFLKGVEAQLDSLEEPKAAPSGPEPPEKDPQDVPLPFGDGTAAAEEGQQQASAPEPAAMAPEGQAGPAEAQDAAAEAPAEEPAKKKRGRPRKKPLDAAVETVQAPADGTVMTHGFVSGSQPDQVLEQAVDLIEERIEAASAQTEPSEAGASVG